MQTKTIYIANDGKEFESEESCRSYEEGTMIYKAKDNHEKAYKQICVELHQIKQVGSTARNKFIERSMDLEAQLHLRRNERDYDTILQVAKELIYYRNSANAHVHQITQLRGKRNKVKTALDGINKKIAEIESSKKE